MIGITPRGGKALDGLNVARKQAAGLVDIADSQRLEDQAVVLVGPRPPREWRAIANTKREFAHCNRSRLASSRGMAQDATSAW